MLILVALVAAGGYWWWTRPAALQIAAWPEDAYITFEGVDYIGDCALEELDPGTYAVRVSRDGFEPWESSIELQRLKTTELEPRLAPIPQDLALASNPSGAAYRIQASDGSVLVGETPFVGELPAGNTVLTLSMDGFNDYRHTVMLDEAREFSFWMDPAGQVVHSLGVWDCGPAPKGAAFTPDGDEIWVTFLAGPPSVQVFDAETGEILDDLILGEHGAVEVLFSEDGEYAYVSQMETARVYEIDTFSREVVRTFDTGSSWTKMMEIHDGSLYASNWTGDDISEIDLESGYMVKRRDTVDTPRGMYVTPDGRSLYVAGFGAGVIEKIDLENGERELVYSGGVAVRHLAGDPTGMRLFCSDMGTDEILVVDLTDDSVSRFLTTDEKPNTIALSPDGTVLFVSCRGANNPASYYLPGPEWGTILLFDAETGEPLDAIVGGNQPTALAVSADGTRMVFSDFLDDRLRLYEIPPFETLKAGGGGLFGAHETMVRK